MCLLWGYLTVFFSRGSMCVCWRHSPIFSNSMFINTCTGMCNLMIKYFFFQDLRMIDPNFVKLFKLAQLTIEYLLVCLL